MKLRIKQIQEDNFVVQQRCLGVWWIKTHGYFSCQSSAEEHLFYLMRRAAKAKFVKRVLGDPGEYELKFLKQQIEKL